MNDANRPVLASQPVTLNLNPIQPNFQSSGGSNAIDSNKFGTNKKNKKIDKSQISGPTGFRVVQHVGLSNNNFEVGFFVVITW